MSLSDIVQSHCAQCEAETERLIQGLVKELEAKDNYITELILQQPQQSEAVTKLLELLRPDIEARERVINHDPRLIELIETYRVIVPA